METTMVGIDRTSSIEREPRTLSIQQMQIARDLAIYVLNTNTVEEASRIFTQGLKPVVSAARDTRTDMDVGKQQGLLEKTATVAPAFRDVASAPF